MIAFAGPEHKNGIIHIWQTCFGDSPAYISFFLENRRKEDRILLWLEEGRPVSMLSLLPARLVLGEGNVPVRYVYAVATLPAYEGQGLSSRLLAYANEGMGREQGPTFLVPASESLFGFYAKRGYRRYFYNKEITFSCEEISLPAGMEESPLEAEEYLRLREERFWQKGAVQWNRQAIEYALQETTLGGGGAWKVTVDGKGYGLLWTVRDDTFIVKETTAPDGLIKEVCSFAATQKGLRRVRARLAPSSTLGGTPQPFGMLWGEGFRVEEGYLGLALD